ncbi:MULTISPECIES: cation:proton antiporter [unclassified Nodularia (in: cyanobacteria)]|uniref:cation:proton antiporter domain-containing protein n=1 Tax=unclassified Nodularia (in: cyanobacteria) TaxID=2656917 RepID=UPI0018814C02|nr:MULTISPECIES: cation:proton antiporter [unclassified Nodularia (in: cyanobacteria)]MBE9200226.1 cation:proton antiporter [Nodularia sp. LEGE 06071]MCC2694267.1 cation:proton antiporter [Nodularia sp. LEGE 04288]
MSQLTSSEINIALITLGGLVLGLGLLSAWLKERLFLSDPLIALVVGVLLSPSVFGLINLAHWGKPEIILEQGARLAIAIQVMGVALRLPKAYPFKHWRILAVLLGLLMPLMWLISGLLVYLLLGLPFWVAMLVGAVITPTDPVVSTSVVTGKVAEQNLPERIRHSISAESAANDGLAYLFVLLPILILTKPPQEALLHWFTKTLLWEVGAAVVMGALIGYLAGRLLQWAEAKQTLEKQSFLAYTVALSLAVLGLVKLLGSDGILAVFAAGITFDMVVSGRDRAEEENVQEAVDRFFTLYIFVLLGLYLPWQQWFELGWKGLLLLVAILLLRRLPAVLLLRPLLGRLRGMPDALFLGWFGPIGVAAVFYAFLSLRKAGVEEPWIIGSLVICASIVAHGCTAVPFAKLYGKQQR